MVATNGILSRKADAMALNHKISMEVSSGSPPVNSMAHSASRLIVPVSINPPTRTNKPTKKKIVGHSTVRNALSITCSPVISSNRKAPANATVADSR
ncbi:hypothetical protein D3C76_1324630 [compost metagenome]